jgi:Methyltransferase domain
MLKKLIKNAGRYAGLEIIRLAPKNFRWSHTVEDYSPIAPKVRWHRGQEPYNRLCSTLNRNRAEYQTFLGTLCDNAKLLQGIAYDPEDEPSNAPFWNNQFFSGLDAAALVNFIAWKRPGRYLEIGSGHSTRFARYAVNTLKLGTKITSIDPMPRQEVDQICDTIIRTPLELCDLALFDELKPRDILFLDGSHRAFSNSDVTVFFFEIMPNLKPGVIVHLHDIFIPNDYPAVWNHRLYNEQYILAAMLMCETLPFHIIAPIAFISQDDALSADAKRALRSQTGGHDIPFFYLDESNVAGVSFWLEIKTLGIGNKTD